MIEKRHKTVIGILLAVSTTMVACSTAPPAKPEKDKAYSELQARLAESERLNKRLDRKIGRLEQVIAKTQDRIEAQTLASQYDLHQQHQPDPVPESRFSGGRSSRAVKDPTGFRKERRISLGRRGPTPTPYGYYEEDSANGDDVIVITQEDFDAFAARSPKPQSSSQNRSSSTGRVAQPDVTQDRLRVTGNNNVGQRPTPARSMPAIPINPNASSLEIYEEGLSLYRSGDFNNSLSRFKSFLAQKPDPSYMDNALYWIGESYFGLNNMKKSIHYFKRVLKETPTGNKVPNAMLKMAIAYRNIGQKKTSKALLSKIIKKYPTSGAGQIAQRELEK